MLPAWEALSQAYPDFYHESPHNILLDALTAQGVVGFLALAALIALGFHAARIARRTEAVLAGILGACVLAGFAFLCDDACIVDLDATGDPMVHAVYGRSKLEPDAAHRLGLSPQRPLYRAYQQDPAAMQEWRQQTFPAIAAEAKRLGAVVFFADEAAVRTDYHAGTLDADRAHPGGGHHRGAPLGHDDLRLARLKRCAGGSLDLTASSEC